MILDNFHASKCLEKREWSKKESIWGDVFLKIMMVDITMEGVKVVTTPPCFCKPVPSLEKGGGKS